MYQACFYDWTQYKYYLRDDKEGWLDFNYKPELYKVEKGGKYETLDGKRANPFKGRYDYTDVVYEKDVDKITRVLVDLYSDSDEPASYQNRVYVDIEMEILGPLTPQAIRTAEAEMTSIALYDESTDTRYCLIVDENGDMESYREPGKVVIICKDEKELILKFLELWQEVDATIVVTWNGRYYDIPYLYFRIRRVFDEYTACKLSPIGKVRVTNSFSQYNREDQDEDEIANAADIVDLGGINHLDYMLLFKKYIVKQEPSYKLGDIGTKYVNLGKIEYSGNLNKLFKEDPVKFIEYNIRDIDIIIELEKKLAFIDLTITLCHLCHTTYESVYFSTVMNDGAILTYLKRKNIVSPNKPTTINPGLRAKNKDAYAGGYLKEPVPGLYEWIIDLDFTSLYPSIIRSLNIGLETFVGRIVNRDIFDDRWTLYDLKQLPPDELVTIEKLDEFRNGVKTQIKASSLIELIEESNLTVAASGGLFRTDKSSVVAEILTDWFNKRSEYKELMKQAYKAGDTELGEFYNRRQHAYKIKLNDVYGSYAINGWRYTDGNKMISASITLTGQRLTKESIIFVNKILNERLGTKNKDYVVTSDTDSLFIILKDVLEHEGVDLSNKEECVKAVLDLADELQRLCNENLNKIAKELYNIGGEHHFQLKQEVVVERGYFAKKRRYAMYIVNKEGVPTEKMEMVGLDLMKSNMPITYKKFGENILKDIIFGKGEAHASKNIMEFKQSLSKLDWKLLGKPTGVKNIRKYIDSPAPEGQIFSKLKNRCPINTRAAVQMNDLFNYWKIDPKFAPFSEGDKMRFIKLKRNPFELGVIGFRGDEDPKELLDFIEEYGDTGESFESVLLNKLTSVYKDIGWSFPSLNKNVSRFFKFD